MPGTATPDTLVPDLDDYDFTLPAEAIAQHPTEERDASKLLVLDRSAPAGTKTQDAVFADLASFLRQGDLLVVNATRVEPARLRGRRESGGAVEALLLAQLPESAAQETSGPRFRAMMKLSGRLRVGIRMHFASGDTELGQELEAEVVALGERGEAILEFEPGTNPYSVGEPPLPPYIRRPDASSAPVDRERYQTLYARVPGAIAAPTAGLHFSESVFESLAAKGVERAEIVLHVGPGTFRPLDDESLQSGRLHTESYELPESTAVAIAETRERGGRVIAVGTTSTRVLEACAAGSGLVTPGAGETDIFLRPGSKFSVVDALVTNFHLPRSSLLLLVAAFAGREQTLNAYQHAIATGYRFYSYGDAMLIL